MNVFGVEKQESERTAPAYKQYLQEAPLFSERRSETRKRFDDQKYEKPRFFVLKNPSTAGLLRAPEHLCRSELEKRAISGP